MQRQKLTGGAQEVSGAALSAGAGAGAAAQDGVARSNPPKPKRKTARKPAAPMPVRLPRVPAVNLNAIRTPVVRGPPLQATAKADKIAKTTGSTPSQHHANIQAAVVRVSEAARKSQRDMVQGVDSIALNTRWSVERMADGIDGVVDRCVASVNGAATAALTTLKDAVRVHEGVIATHTQAGAEELATQQAAVDAQIMANLNVGGSEVMLAAHQNLIAAYDIHLEGVTPKLHALSDGTTPVPLTSEHGEVAETTFDAPKSGITTFEGAAAAIAQTLLTIPGAGDHGR